MDNKLLIYILLIFLLLFIVVAQQLISKKFIQDLSNLLYQKQDGNNYLIRLNSWYGKLMLGAKKRLFMSVDGYLLLEDYLKIEECFDKLNKSRLSFTQKIGLYQKEIQYYISVKKYSEAIKINDDLQKLGAVLADDKNMAYILEENNLLIEIDCKHNAKLAKKMLEKAKESQGELAKGIYFLRAAKCYYYGGDTKNMNKYLKEAELKTTGSTLNKQILKYLNDPSLMD